MTGLIAWCLAFGASVLQGQATSSSQGAPGRSTSSSEKPVRILGPFASREDQDEYTKVVLKNGLTLIVYERKDLPLVSISTYVKTGYLNEPDTAAGDCPCCRTYVLQRYGTPRRWSDSQGDQGTWRVLERRNLL